MMMHSQAYSSPASSSRKQKSFMKRFKNLMSSKTSSSSSSISSSSSSITTLNATTPTPTTATMQRRAEALKSMGLLSQSKIYGQGAYRDDGNDDDLQSECTLAMSSEGKGEKLAKQEKDLISFDVDDEISQKRERAGNETSLDTHAASDSSLSNPNGESASTSTSESSTSASTSTLPTTPTSDDTCSHLDLVPEVAPLACAEELSHSSSAGTVAGEEKVKIRRVGSMRKEVERIEDEESRRLTEVAFFS